MTGRRAFQAALIACAVAAAVLPVPATFIERWFATGIYPHIQRVITPLGNLLPFAWFDLILLVAVGGTITLLVRAGRQARHERRWLPLLECGWTLCVGAASLYLVFLFLWGLNYRRVPMAARIEMRAAAPGRQEVLQLGQMSVEQLNALYDAAHSRGWAHDEWRDDELVDAFGQAQQLVEDTPQVVPGRLKSTLLGPYFRWTAVDGMVDPFALEVLVNPDLLPWERPFVAAHEWAHLAGFADESEASFVGWLACLRGTEPARYSGWLYLFWEIGGDLTAADRASMLAALQPGPRRDIAAISERLRRGQLPGLRSVSWAVYDQYLRANRVEEGIRSYGEVVTLILRAQFDEGYRPIRRTGSAPSP